MLSIPPMGLNNNYLNMAVFNSTIFNPLQWNTKSLLARRQDIFGIFHFYNISIALIF